MRYADSLLADGEVVVVRSRQHWLALLIEGRAGVALLMVGLVLVVVAANLNQSARDIVSLIALVSLVVGLLLFGLQAWQWWAQDYMITNRRILKVEGIINKRSADSSLEKINDAILEQNLWGRILGYGDLDILTAADAAIDRYRMLDRAPAFKREMINQKHLLESGYGGPQTPPLRTRAFDLNGDPARDHFPESPPEPAQPRTAPPAPHAAAQAGQPTGTADPVQITRTLERLADLRDRGAITPEEYAAKKDELLGRL